MFIHSDRKLKITRMWADGTDAISPKTETLGSLLDQAGRALDKASASDIVGYLYVEAEDGRCFKVNIEAILDEVPLGMIEDEATDETVQEVR